MEMAVSGSEFRFPHLVIPPPTPSFSLLPHSVSPLEYNKRYRLFAVAIPSTAEPQAGKARTPQKLHLKSYLTRKSAINKVEQSPDFLSALERLKGVLKVQDLNVILRDFGTQGRWQDLSQLFNWMQNHGKTNGSTYSSYIKLVGQKSSAKALEIYNSIPDESTKLNIFICNSVLSCLVKNGKLDSAIKLFGRMKGDGLTPDEITYNTLLAGCIKVKNGYSKALELVEEVKQKGIQMDAVMYGTILAICASNGRWQDAQSFFQQMKDQGHSPNIYHFSSILNAYSSDGNHTKADELVHEMRSAGLAPNKVIMTTLLKVYIRGGLFERSKELLAELQASGYAEDEIPYCLLMDGLSKAGKLDEAMSIFVEMKERGVKSEGYSHSIMISALCRNKLFEKAKDLAKDFEEKYDKYDLVMLNTLLCAYCRADDMESVMQTMKRMDELAISPDYNTFHILIKYFMKQKLYQLAYKTMVDLHSKGHQPQEELCSSLIFYLGKSKAYSEAFAVYNILRYSKRNICKKLHEKILHSLIAGQLLKDAYVVVKDNAKLISRPAIKKFGLAFIKLGNINMIHDVLKVIHGSGHKIDQGQFEMAISRFMSQPEKKELLLQLLRWMPGHGYAVDSSTRNLILRNSRLFGSQLIAEILSKHHVVLKASSLVRH